MKPVDKTIRDALEAQAESEQKDSSTRSLETEVEDDAPFSSHGTTELN